MRIELNNLATIRTYMPLFKLYYCLYIFPPVYSLADLIEKDGYFA
jgi:hypothetical protein